MKNIPGSLALDAMQGLKKIWMNSNPHAKAVMDHFQNKYGALPRPDHMAIRSISGISFGQEEARRIFSNLGWRFGGLWWIPDLHIAACHFEPPQEGLEKVFFSSVLLEEFSHSLGKKEYQKFSEIIYRNTCDVSRLAVDIELELNRWKKLKGSEKEDAWGRFIKFFTESPWEKKILKEDFMWLAERPQFQEVLHVLAYGFIPNHFTFLMQDPKYKFSGYTSMKELSRDISELGIPMQEEVEGEEESILCQVSTKAYAGKLSLRDETDGGIKNKKIEWPMSYIEFIRRGSDPHSQTGRYEGFLPKQAKTLFKMTASRVTSVDK